MESVQGAESGEARPVIWRDLYEDIARDCFRYFGFTSLDQVDRMTVREYRLMAEAYRLASVDSEYKMHKLAFLTFAASATDKKGRPRYKRFEKFFNYEKEIKKAQNTEADRFSELKRHIREKNRDA